jgi:hypothetical protein
MAKRTQPSSLTSLIQFTITGDQPVLLLNFMGKVKDAYVSGVKEDISPNVVSLFIKMRVVVGGLRFKPTMLSWWDNN